MNVKELQKRIVRLRRKELKAQCERILAEWQLRRELRKERR